MSIVEKMPDECEEEENDTDKYVHIHERVLSFAGWPKTTIQKPEDLADAGFYYIGVSDRVKCYTCGGGLKDWEPEDDPWEEHALAYGEDCMYVKVTKGASFIQNVKTDYEIRSAKNNITISDVQGNVIKSSNKDRKLSNDDHNKVICKICYDNEVNTILEPCHHVAMCEKCVVLILNCPICRTPILKQHEIYFS